MADGNKIEPAPTVVSLADVRSAAPRVPEHGRIRMGMMGVSSKGKPIPTSTTEWRLTSTDRQALDVLAGIYGGEVKAWRNAKANPPDQFELLTATDTLKVLLPRDSLSIWYEQWTGGGCARRCDGEHCEIPAPGGDSMQVTACLCMKQGQMQCKPYTRLNVIFPEVEFGGYWRMETKGWNAMRELPAMEEILSQLRAVGIIQAKLILEQRQSQGGSKKFVVPKIQIPASVLEIMSGAASLGAIPPVPVGELDAGEVSDVDAFGVNELDPGRPFDDDIVDAVIVEDGNSARIEDLVELCNAMGKFNRLDGTTVLQGLVLAASKNQTHTIEELDGDQLTMVETVAGDINVGKYRIMGFEPSGRIKLTKGVQ